jgi:hypothetical protein
MANTHGEKELRTDWDALTASDSTKAVGHAQSLKAEVSNVEERYLKGIRW